jgi:peptidoglycan/LPS O-acetylase OafA/YrhL
VILLCLFQLVLIFLPGAVRSWVGHAPRVHGFNQIIKTIPSFTQHLCEQFNMMVIGAGAALIYRNRSQLLLNFIYHRMARVIILLTIALNLAVEIWQPDLVLGICFGALIVSFTDPNLKTPFQAATQYLGRISYGIYMYHVLVLCMVLRLIQNVPSECISDFGRVVVIYAATLVGTIGVAALSYRFLESPILRLKRRFALVASGNPGRV